MELRSTPIEFSDCAVVTDRRGKRWKYSEPADVWGFVDHQGLIAPHSARSYQRLNADFGPLAKVADPE